MEYINSFPYILIVIPPGLEQDTAAAELEARVSIPIIIPTADSFHGYKSLFSLVGERGIRALDNLLLADIGIVRLYECDSKPYLYLPTWEVHQTIRAKKSKYPAPDLSESTSEIICKQLQANVSVIQSNPNPKEKTPSGTKRKGFDPPTVDEVREYCEGKNNGIHPEASADYYAARGWKYGSRRPLVD